MIQEQIQTQSSPITYAEPDSKIQSRRDPNRHLTRYVFCIGDHIPPEDKIGLRSVGGWAGGVYVGHSEHGGCPTMKRTKYLILRGAIVPLETTPFPKSNAHRALAPNDEEYLQGSNTRAYTIYAGDSLNDLQAASYRAMGVVEITALSGQDWNTQEARNLQLHFFPQWGEWAKGKGKFPSLLSEWEDLIKDGQTRAVTQAQYTTGEEMMESVRNFRTGALNHIERNRQLMNSTRNVNMGGFSIRWNPRSRLFAAQLGITLEDEVRIAEQNKISPNDEALRREEMALKREEIELRRREVELRERDAGVVRETPTAPLPTIIAPEVPMAAEVDLPPLEFQETETVEKQVPSEPFYLKIGQTVKVKGEAGIITSKPFGKITVKLASGENVTVAKDEVEIVAE
mgnify:CR=1 FL=1